MAFLRYSSRCDRSLAGAGPIGKVLVQIKVLQPYQYRRIEAWLNPELDPEGKSFQVLQGLYAIGSGGLLVRA